jgi:hypothetical protein
LSSKNNTEPLEDENDVRHALCVVDDDDDDIDEQDWGDIYKRLKTNYTDDLHIVNTRFNTTALQSLPDGSVRTAGPIFTSTVAERPTRITSANYNPHAVALERDKSRTKSALPRKTYIMEDESSKESKVNTTGLNTGESLKFEKNLSNQANSINKENSHGESIDENLTNPLVQEHLFQGQKCLDVPYDLKRMQSPAPKGAENDCLAGDDSDFDPFEGLDIPRQRVHSFGSASVYSVKEISDDVFQQYKTEIKNCIRSYGFFEAFPSPTIISEAQKIYRRLDLPSPVDDDGNVLPHPPKVTKSEYLAAETNTLEEARDRIKNVSKLFLNSEFIDNIHAIIVFFLLQLKISTEIEINYS